MGGKVHWRKRVRTPPKCNRRGHASRGGGVFRRVPSGQRKVGPHAVGKDRNPELGFRIVLGGEKQVSYKTASALGTGNARTAREDCRAPGRDFEPRILLQPDC